MADIATIDAEEDTSQERTETPQERTARSKRNFAKRKRAKALEAKQEAQKRAEKDARMPAVLRDMKHVYTNPKKGEEPPGQKTARIFLESDPKGFLSQMNALEREHREREEEFDRMERAKLVAAAESSITDEHDADLYGVVEGEWSFLMICSVCEKNGVPHESRKVYVTLKRNHDDPVTTVTETWECTQGHRWDVVTYEKEE